MLTSISSPRDHITVVLKRWAGAYEVFGIKIKQPRKNKVFDYKSLIYETYLKVLIMFKRDKHLQTETAVTPLCCKTGGGVWYSMAGVNSSKGHVIANTKRYFELYRDKLKMH